MAGDLYVTVVTADGSKVSFQHRTRCFGVVFLGHPYAAEGGMKSSIPPRREMGEKRMGDVEVTFILASMLRDARADRKTIAA